MAGEDERIEITWDDLGGGDPSPPAPAQRTAGFGTQPAPPTPAAPTAAIGVPPAPTPPAPPATHRPPPPPAPPAPHRPPPPPAGGPGALPPLPTRSRPLSVGQPSSWAPAPPGGYVPRPPSSTNWGLVLGIGGGVLAVIVIVVVVVLAGRGSGELSPGEEVSGSVDVDEEQRYTIEGEGRTVSITVDGENGFDPTVEVFTGSGTSIGYDDDGGSTPLGSYLEVHLDRGQSYDVVVSGYAGRSGSFEVTLR